MLVFEPLRRNRIILNQLSLSLPMKIKITKHSLNFKQAAGTSRGILKKKDTWYIKVSHSEQENKYGLGEINMFQGLSWDDTPLFYSKLKELEQNPDIFINDIHLRLKDFPSIRFGLETALLDLQGYKNHIIFPSDFTNGKEGIPINGLIWMGDKDFMIKQIKSKLNLGFKCLKLKIGAINFDTEFGIIKSIRKEYDKHDLELRVDANGAFEEKDALNKLDQLSTLHLHSIEQPIKQGNWEFMKYLCNKTPLAIALDEELIGINDSIQKAKLLKSIHPQYIILKPSLTGGFQASKEWIELANSKNIGWWITSALESNIGLNAIAQWTFLLQTNNYQGLGTGQLFTNNINSPLCIHGEKLFYHPEKEWGK